MTKRARTLVAIACAVFVLAGAGWWIGLPHAGRAGQGGRTEADEGLRDPALIAKGRYLATIGDCAACHTARGGAAFAGGRAVPTPFGAIPAPNITPDDRTGIGRWRFSDFWAALHTGKGRRGEWLYPAFPYTAYTRVNRDDARALFAYLRSLAPVRRPNAAARLDFPYNLRAGLAFWRLLYFTEGVYQPDPSRSAQWNRGAYLVEGLGHCNECHAERGVLGGLRAGTPLGGGEMPAQGWYAPDLGTGDGGGLAGWTRQDIVDVLRTGQSSHGVAFGPMAEVVERSTQYLHDDDLQAVATYLLALPPRPSAEAADPPKAGTADVIDRGRALYARRCAACHGREGEGRDGVYPALAGNVSVLEPSGIDATRVVLLGGFAPTTAAHPRPYSMPPFAQSLNDAEVAAVVSYIRQAWGNRADAVPERMVGRYRQTPLH